MKTWIPVVISACVLTACGGGGGSDSDSNTVINEQQKIPEGVQIAYKLPAGNYSAQITASNNGVAIEWVGGTCPSASETKSYSQACQLTQAGQLVVSNPTLLGMGGDELVTVRVNKN